MLISLYQFVANKIVLHQFSNLISHKLSKVVDILFFPTGYLVEKDICLISITVQVIKKILKIEYVKTLYSIELYVLF